VVGDIGPTTDWTAALRGAATVIHLAGRAHVLRERALDPRAEFMRVNAEGTAALVTAAVKAGVTRVIYVSSIGVLGDATSAGAFTMASTPRPHNAYAESKLAGEVIARSSAGNALEVVVVRPPLVYGPGVRANFLRLLRLVRLGLPLPFGSIENRRSMVSVWNLCDLLVRLLSHPHASRGEWLVTDGEDLSTPELIRRIGRAMQRRVLLLPVPPPLLATLGQCVGRRAEIRQLCGSLAVDATETRRLLDWTPPVAVDEGLARTVAWFVTNERIRS
jgi:nucleoside-diphosphate-sugar epimerase